MATTRSKSDELLIQGLEQGVADFCILGKTPFLIHRVAAKARRELLLPKGRKTAADRAQALKHDPVAEFRDALYTFKDDLQPTRICFPSSGWKRSMCTAALETPGSKKAQIGRLVWVEGQYTPIFGIPRLFMDIVRSSDMQHTPDVRTWPRIDEWACRVTVSFAVPQLTVEGIATLLANAGLVVGMGDGRQEKGIKNFGQFELVSHDDERFQRIITTGGREAQDQAIEDAEPFDGDTEELLSWFNAEVKARGRVAKVKEAA